MTQLIGWASSLILVLTIGQQVYRQWRSRTSEGVSLWLFLGQIVASVGFVTYSLLVKDWVFVVTNSLLLCNGLLGLVIVLRHRQRKRGYRASSLRGSRRLKSRLTQESPA